MKPNLFWKTAALLVIGGTMFFCGCKKNSDVTVNQDADSSQLATSRSPTHISTSRLKQLD